MPFSLFDLLINEGLYESHSYKQNEIIKHQYNAHHKKIYFVKRGFLKLSYSREDGEETIPILLSENQFFGSIQVFNECHYDYKYETIHTETLIYEFKILTIKSYIQNDNNLHEKLCALIGMEYIMLEKRIKLLQRQFVKQRVIETLLEFKERNYNQVTPSKIQLFIPITQEEFSNYIRASRVITNKVINDLRKELLIECQHNSIIINKSFFDAYPCW